MQQAPSIDFGIILAAGGSTRMGRPKALLDYHGEALINAHIRHLRMVCKDIIVVTGGHAPDVHAILDPSVTIVHNQNWSTTQMADSLRMALEHCTGLAVVTPVDCPPAPPHVLQQLTSAGCPAVCTHQNQDGHPVIVDSLQAKQNHGTLHDIMSTALRVPIDWPGILENWNTPADVSAYSSSGSLTRN